MAFWSWFWGIGKPVERSGVRRFINRWLLVHLTAACALTYFVPVTLKEAANTVLLPLAGLFIGLCFAWGGNALALLQTAEIEEVAKRHDEGFDTYPFVFQSAVLTVIVAIVLWGIAGLGVLEPLCDPKESARCLGTKSLLYGWASLSLRECWHVVLGAQLLLLSRMRIRDARRKRGKNE